MPGTPAAASYGDMLVTSLVVLGGVCIAAFVVVRLLGRLLATGRARGAHLLDVVARVPLEPRRSLYVVEVAGKTLLVGTSEMGLSVLSELDGGEVRARVVARPTFGELVRDAWLRRRRPAAEPGEPVGAEAARAGADGVAAAGPSGAERPDPGQVAERPGSGQVAERPESGHGAERLDAGHGAERPDLGQDAGRAGAAGPAGAADRGAP